MPFDWFTIVAQIINFLILLYLLRRYLYRPILSALDARELRVKNALKEASTKNIEAKRLQKLYKQKDAELAQDVQQIIEKAKTDAKARSAKLLDTARITADEILLKNLELQQSKLLSMQQHIQDRNVAEVYATAGKILHELSGTSLEKAVMDKFLSRISKLEAEEYKALCEAIQSTNTLLVRSAFELTDKNKKEITSVLMNILNQQKILPVIVNFVHVPNLISGLELNGGTWKLCWSAQYHLKTLHEKVSDILQLAAVTQNKDILSEVHHSEASLHQL
jgi:F-type H+-transporting ATPase subunit b